MEHFKGTGVVVAPLNDDTIEALACNQAGELIDLGLDRDIARREYWDTKRSLLALVKLYGKLKVSMSLKTAEYVLMKPNAPKFGLELDPEDEQEAERQELESCEAHNSTLNKTLTTDTHYSQQVPYTGKRTGNKQPARRTHNNRYTTYTKGRLLSKARIK